MSAVERFRRFAQRSGMDRKEKAENEARRNFRKLLRETPSAEEIQATVPDEVSVTSSTRTILAMVNDIALNDQRALDEKYIHVENDTDIDVGCYVRWREKNWLLTFEEVNGFDTHKTFVMKRCNQIFRFMYNDEIYDIPVSATNLTLYSDGLADGVYVSRADAKRNVKFGSNPITRMVDLGHRVMLTNKTVFRVTHMDDFSYNGLIGCIVLQTAIIPEDDLENNVAYNPNFIIGDNGDGDQGTTDKLYVQGSDSIFLGSEEVYISNRVNIIWTLEDESGAFTMTSSSSNACNICVSTDSRYIGCKAMLIATTGDGSEMYHKEIVVKNYF